MKCKCGKDAHPLYGSRCEDCYAVGVGICVPENYIQDNKEIKYQPVIEKKVIFWNKRRKIKSI